MQQIIQIKQNSANYFNLKDNAQFIDKGFSPCIIIIYTYQENENYFLSYYHFDENEIEINAIKKNLKTHQVKKIILLGGYGSYKINTLLKILKYKKIEKITEKDLEITKIDKIEYKDNQLNLKSTSTNKEQKIHITQILKLCQTI